MGDCEQLRWRRTIRVLSGTSSPHIGKELQRLGLQDNETVSQTQNAEFFVLKVDHLPEAWAKLLKHQLLATGANAATPPDELPDDQESSPLIASATRQQLRQLDSALRQSEHPATTVSNAFLEVVDKYTRSRFAIAYPGGELDLSEKTAVMGVVNVTPDSFSDGGDCYSTEAALRHAFELTAAGADIVDIGGESTRPGSEPVSTDEEIRRVVPVIEALSSQAQVLISVDTYKPEVAREAVAAGAKMVNDIAGLHEDSSMAAVIGELGVAVVIMHMKGKPKTMQEDPVYDDLMLEIHSYLAQGIEVARSFGIGPDRLMVDPGIGFGKTFEHNLVILDRLSQLRSFGLPVCVGVSRKAFLGAILRQPEPKKRLIGTVAACVSAVRSGAKIIRVHDVKEAVEAVRVTDAISTHTLLMGA